MPLSSSPSEFFEEEDQLLLSTPLGSKIALLAKIDAPQADKLTALLILNNGGTEEPGAAYALNMSPRQLAKAWFLDQLQFRGSPTARATEIFETGKRIGHIYNSHGRYLITIEEPTPLAGDIATMLVK